MIFGRKSEPISSAVVEPWAVQRGREIPRELAKLEAELESLDEQMQKFWGGADPRPRLLRDSSVYRFQVPNFPKLRDLESARTEILRRRSELLSERAGLLGGK